MERNGASHHITGTRTGGTDAGARVLAFPWQNSEAIDSDTGLQMSVANHPSGGHTARVDREHAGRSESFEAGPFSTDYRAKVAAESLGQRALGPRQGGQDASKYRRT